MEMIRFTTMEIVLFFHTPILLPNLLNIFYSWGKYRFAFPAATKWSQGGLPERKAKGTFLSDPDLSLLSQRKKKVNEFQTIPRMKAVRSLRWALSMKLKIYKDLFGFLLSDPLGFLLGSSGNNGKIKGELQG